MYYDTFSYLFIFKYFGVEPTKSAFVPGGHLSSTKLKSVYKFKSNDTWCFKNYTKAKLYNLKKLKIKLTCVQWNIGETFCVSKIYLLLSFRDYEHFKNGIEGYFVQILQ